MNPSFRCPSCSSRFRVEEKYLGRRVRCPNPDCQAPVHLVADATAPTRNPDSSLAEPSASSRTPEPALQPPVERKTTSVSNSNSTVPTQPRAKPSPQTRVASSSQQRPRSRALPDPRYQTQSALWPIILGFALTSVFGGAAIAGYWYWNNSGNSVLADEGNDDPRLPASSDGRESDRSPNQVGARSADGALNLAASQLTSAVSGAILRKNAERQKLLEDKVLPFLSKHCSECHNADTQEGGLHVHQLTTVDQLLKDRKKWERVYRMINAGAMPPSDYEPQPEDAARSEVADIFHEELYNFDCTQIHHAGRSTLHRLNRAEYNNTIRDLFGLSLSPADKFPQDDVGEGFDNIGDVLSIPPLLMEKYLDAAEEVAAAVIDTRDFSKGSTQRFEATKFKSTLDGNINEAGFSSLNSTGSVTVPVETPAEGTYRIRIEAAATQAGDEDAKMALQIDGKNVQEFVVTGQRKPGWHEHDLTLSAGSHSVGAAFLNDFYQPDAPDKSRRDRNLGVRAIEVIGPEGGGQPQWHETHRRFVTARPSDTVSIRDAAATVLRPILYRSFRRPVAETEVERFSSLVDETVSQYKESYEYGLFVAVQAILVSPDFLFRKEADPEGTATERALNEYEIASRLSYFLWSSMPDDELFQLAENKRLLDRTILRGQIERMLRDEKALALARNFAAQWLNLRNLSDIRPNSEVFPDFDDALRAAMREETETLFTTIVREDRSVDDFLTADFTFVNERLAKHYGIQGVSGDQFVRVSLEGSQRSGVLTHGSILTLTSNPGRTSPVKRGKWILENILGEAPPPPPPGVPPLEEAAKDVSGLSLRERLEIHRKDPGCASCHKTMDPLGMGLENFDAIGRWRDNEGEKPVDASGDLPSGEKFSGPIQLISIIRGRQEQFYRTLTERLMVYALGRGLEYYDKCAVDRTMETMKQRGNRFSALVEGIVTSDPFMKRSKTREFEIPPTQF